MKEKISRKFQGNSGRGRGMALPSLPSLCAAPPGAPRLDHWTAAEGIVTRDEQDGEKKKI